MVICHKICTYKISDYRFISFMAIILVIIMIMSMTITIILIEIPWMTMIIRAVATTAKMFKMMMVVMVAVAVWWRHFGHFKCHVDKFVFYNQTYYWYAIRKGLILFQGWLYLIIYATQSAVYHASTTCDSRPKIQATDQRDSSQQVSL